MGLNLAAELRKQREEQQLQERVEELSRTVAKLSTDTVGPAARDWKNREAVQQWWWVVREVPYESKRAAAEALQVSPRTIQRWCNGYVRRGEVVPPAPGCRVVAR